MEHATSVPRPKLVVAESLSEAAAHIFLDASPRTLVLAGGSTPRPVYQRLAQLDHPWRDTQVFFTDERCVPYGHPDSNYGMAKAALLDATRPQVFPFPADCDWFAYETLLRELFPDATAPNFDLAFLGIGADGHTASLFPGDAALDMTHRWVARVLRGDHQRLTLTAEALSGARHAVFLVLGAEKREALARVLDGEDLPPNRIHAERVTIIADAAAAP